jgi:drug/metabolite transporter (DMT)-like permease
MRQSMANDYLTFKNLTIITSILSWLFGIGFVLIPNNTLDMYDVTLYDEGYHVTKLFGAAFILIGLIAWFIRDLEPSDLRRNLSIGFIVGNGLGAILSIINIFNDDTDANGLEWLNVILYGALAAGFVYFAFFETDEAEEMTPT